MPADIDLRVRDGSARDDTAIVETLTCAIAATPVARCLLPGNNVRARQLRARLTTVVTEQIGARYVRVAEHDGRIIGATLWTICTTAAAPGGPHMVLLNTSGDAHHSRLLHARLAQRHPTRPHHHLLALGVRPDRQRHGIGTRLLADWHHQLRPQPRRSRPTAGATSRSSPR